MSASRQRRKRRPVGDIRAGEERPGAQPFEPRRVLYWIYGGRLVVCLAVYGSAIVVGGVWSAPAANISIAQRLIAISGLGAAALLTPVAYWHSHWRVTQPGQPFIYSQAILDGVLVTGIVHITGGSHSVFPPLFYIVLASGYALLLPLASAMVVALGIGTAYLFDVGLFYPEQVDAPVIAQIAILTVVASVSSMVGARSRRSVQRLRSVEGELHRLRADTEGILRSIISGVINFDARGHVLYMNPAASGMLGVQSDVWLDRDLLSSLVSHAPEIADAVLETLQTGEIVSDREVEIVQDALKGVDPPSPPGASASGGTGTMAPGGVDQPALTKPPRAVRPPEGAAAIPLAVSTTLLSGPAEVRSVTLVMQDLRMVRQLEDLRLQAGRLEAVAELSASLAHEIRNPLAAIRSAAEQLDARERADEEDRLLSRLVLQESDRLHRLLGEFSEFARVGITKRQPVRIDKLIRDAVAVVRQHPAAGATVQIEVEVEPGLEDLWGDPDLLHRVLVNLVLNAVQVGADRPALRVRVIADALRPARVPAESAYVRPVRIRVMDNGPGIAPEDLGRIFDPFYTRRKGGSGLGLSIAHRAVHAHGGALMASSVPGSGATFIMVLPRRGGERPGDQAATPLGRVEEERAVRLSPT